MSSDTAKPTLYDRLGGVYRKDDRANGKTGSPPVAWRLFLGDDFSVMARNQVRNVTERRIRTVSYICAA